MNAVTNGGATPLHRAAHQASCSDHLRQYPRVDCNFDAVVNQGHLSITKALLDAGADPLIQVICRGNHNFLAKLVESGDLVLQN